MKNLLLRSINLRQYKVLNAVRYFPDKSSYRPINIRDVYEIVSRRKKSSPLFIQIGSFDGVSNDPIHEYVKRYNWKGVLVEPMPVFFEKLKSNYAGSKDLVFENVGIGDQEGEFDFFHLPIEYNEPQWLQQIGSFNKNSLVVNLKDSYPELIDKIQTRKIKALTLNNLIQKHGITEIDFLNIDAEGFEYTILKDLNNISVKPGVILFEWGCMSSDDLNKLLSLLKQNRYSIYSSGGDMVAMHEAGFGKYS